MRIKRSYKHQRIVQQLIDVLLISLDADHTVVGERDAPISQQTNGLQDILDNQWFEHIQFEMSVGAPDGHGNLDRASDTS